MFAVVPLIVIGVWIGLGGIGGIVLSIIAWKARRWFKKDPNKDMVIFMGRPQVGKSELLAALKGGAFDPKRTGTGARYCKYGVKDFVVCDSGGNGKNIKIYVDHVVEDIREKQPNFILVVLVTNVQDFNWFGLPPPEGKNFSEHIDSLAEYLDFFTTTCEEECRTENKIKTMLGENYFTKRYNNGHWAYAVIGTHLGKMNKASVTEGLTNLTRRLDHYCRKMNFAGTGVFELSEKKMRDSTVCYIEELLKRLHAS